MIGGVVIVFVVVVDVEELVHGDEVCGRIAVGGRSKSTVILSAVFGLVDVKFTGSVTIILFGDGLFDIASTDNERTAVGGGI